MDDRGDGSQIPWDKKARYFMENKIEAFVMLLNGQWRSGFITDVGIECFLIDSPIDGVTPIFYFEIKDINVKWRKE